MKIKKLKSKNYTPYCGGYARHRAGRSSQWMTPQKAHASLKNKQNMSFNDFHLTWTHQTQIVFLILLPECQENKR